MAMAALGTIVRRLVHPWAFAIAIALIASAGSLKGMFAPLRIDHHGWQLALLALCLLGLCDPKSRRGGLILGAASAASLAIGLEMLLYLGLCGGILVARSVLDREEATRLFAYGAALGGGVTFAFLVFASQANRAPVCDALSPVWLSAMLGAAALAVTLGILRLKRLTLRLGAAAAGGFLLATAFYMIWPECFGPLEQAPELLDRLWLSRVREAIPVWRHGVRMAALIVTLPLFGLLGYALMLWRSRGERPALIAWASLAAPALLAAALLLWQTRAGPAAQLTAIPGATALAVTALIWVGGRQFMLVRVFGAVAAFLVVSGLATGYLTRLFPETVSDFRRRVNLANSRCPTLAALTPVARQRPGRVLTFVDLGPRLIAVTPHHAIAGPYHRNHRPILDVMLTWRGDEANARETVGRYRIDYVLICPNLSESTIYSSEAPNGFYARLARGQVPAWLEPIELPPQSPWRMWRVRN